jgi:hypothetical protein
MATPTDQLTAACNRLRRSDDGTFARIALREEPPDVAPASSNLSRCQCRCNGFFHTFITGLSWDAMRQMSGARFFAEQHGQVQQN